jgi:dTDP-4-dehydrorhamnose 3,5-epimerase-like enzyme
MISDEFWKGISPAARQQLEIRSYSQSDLAARLSTTGVEAREISGPGVPAGLEEAWIPGVVLFPRRVFAQPQRGFFGEFTRGTEGPLATIGMWPQQWAAARMFSGTAKGFHIHPPHIPEGTDPAVWFQKLFVEEPDNFALRPYSKEQWDAMFFLQGIVEMLLVDERPGLPRRAMRFTIYGDDLPGANNAGIIIPAGVAHALRGGSSQDVLMVYGTSTTFVPANEGRLASSVEASPLPDAWQNYLNGSACS